MSFVSYAQNFEDVLLWRALGHVKGGFYIDVGANDPIEFSVTKAFYDAGWNGINIEPLAAFHALFMELRPRDINLTVAAGAEEGEIVLFDVPAVNGWASSSPEVAAMHSAEGYQVVEQRVPLRTLDAIWREHVTGPVHFLKIDVEGFEEQVLRGLDLARARPWVLVIEATTPNSRATNHETWEHLVTPHAYLFAYFDGLNRYYVAAEHAHLRDSLQVQANVFDDAITARLSEALHSNDALQARLDAIEAAVAEQKPPEPGDEEGKATARLEQRQHDTDAASSELWHNALPSLTQQLNNLQQRIEQTRTGSSAETHAEVANVERRLRETVAIVEQHLTAQNRALEAHLGSITAAADEKIAQFAAANTQRDTEHVAQAAALEARLVAQIAESDQTLADRLAIIEARLFADEQMSVSRSTALESQLSLTERRFGPPALRLHDTDRRLASTAKVAGQFRRRADDVELATAFSAVRVEQAEQRAIQLEQQIKAVMASSSWRITAPWRLVGGLVRRIGSAARDGRLRSGMRRRIVHVVLGPGGPDANCGARGWMRQAAQWQWARRIVLPAMQRSPQFNTAMRRLAGTAPAVAAVSVGELFLPEWPGPLPAEYLTMPPATRAILLDLARAGLPAQPMSVMPPQS